MIIGRSKTVELLGMLKVEGSEPYIGRPYGKQDDPIPEPVPPPCIPVDFDGSHINADPLKNPYEVNDVIEFSLSNPPTGTTPITYQWYVDGDPRDTTETFTYTVASADVRDKVGDFGQIYIVVILTNPCGEVTSNTYSIDVFDP